MKIYCISGLGADERVFQFLKFPNYLKVVHLAWLAALPGETLEQYALRLSQPIGRNERFYLLGLSMGGMIASEISKIKIPQKLILISSIKCAQELPPLYKWAGKYGLHTLLKPALLKNISILKKYYWHYTAQNRKLLIDVIRSSDDAFIKWATNAIIHWECDPPVCDCIQIHGTHDRVLPIKFTNPTHIIKGGRHFMVVERAEEISNILNDVLQANYESPINPIQVN